MDWFKRLQRWQRLWAVISLIGLAATGLVTASAYPQANPRLVKQMTSAECAAMRSLPSSEINVNALRKEQYALYLQCEDLFWYKARHPDAALTLEDYENHLKKEQMTLVGQASLICLGTIAALYVLLFGIVRAFSWTQRRPETTESPQ